MIMLIGVCLYPPTFLKRQQFSKNVINANELVAVMVRVLSLAGPVLRRVIKIITDNESISN